MNKLKKYKDYLSSDKKYEILRFGEYRKGSSTYGLLIQDLMMFLRNYKKDDDNELIFKVSEITLDVDLLYKLSIDENKKRLISFDISFMDSNKHIVDKIDKNGYIVFSDLNKKNYDRPWENNSFNF